MGLTGPRVWVRVGGRGGQRKSLDADQRFATTILGMSYGDEDKAVNTCLGAHVL